MTCLPCPPKHLCTLLYMGYSIWKSSPSAKEMDINSLLREKLVCLEHWRLKQFRLQASAWGPTVSIFLEVEGKLDGNLQS